MCKRLITVLLASLAAVHVFGPSAAQASLFGKPKVRVPVYHAPQLALKGVTRIAVSEIKGRCGREVGDQLTQALVESGKFEVLNREHLDALLREANFNFSGVVDTRTAGKLGQILGAAALIFGHVTTCDASTTTGYREQRGFLSKNVQQVPVTRTTAYVAGSVQLVELTSGRIYTAKAIDGRAEQVEEGTSRTTTHEVLVAAYRSAAAQFLRTILPWSETVELVVHDDDKWGLNVGAAFVKAGDFVQAAEVFRKALEEGTRQAADDKMLAKAYHNLGVALMYSGHVAEGQEALMKSLSIKPTDDTQEALRNCRQLIATEQEIRLQEQQAVGIGEPGVTVSRAAAGHTCPHCRAAVDANAKFCPNCGKKIDPGHCPQCNRPVSPSQKFCPACGARLSQ